MWTGPATLRPSCQSSSQAGVVAPGPDDVEPEVVPRPAGKRREPDDVLLDRLEVGVVGVHLEGEFLVDDARSTHQRRAVAQVLAVPLGHHLPGVAVREAPGRTWVLQAYQRSAPCARRSRVTDTRRSSRSRSGCRRRAPRTARRTCPGAPGRSSPGCDRGRRPGPRPTGAGHRSPPVAQHDLQGPRRGGASLCEGGPGTVLARGLLAGRSETRSLPPAREPRSWRPRRRRGGISSGQA